MLSCCNAWPVKACIEMGTSCMLCERRCAVTVISSSASLPASTVAARHLAPDKAPRTAAIDMDSLEFMNHPLRYKNFRRHAGTAAGVRLISSIKLTAEQLGRGQPPAALLGRDSLSDQRRSLDGPR